MVFRTPLKFFVPSNKDHENTDMSSTESLNLNEIRSSLPNPTVNLEMVRQFSIWLNKSIEIMTRYVTKFKSRSVNAAVLLTRAVILRIVFKTGIILSMKKKQSVKMTSQSVKFLTPLLQTFWLVTTLGVLSVGEIIKKDSIRVKILVNPVLDS